MTTPAMYAPRILLFKGRGVVSRCIRWQTRSEYSHAALMLKDGSIVEAWQGEGVRTTRLKDWCNVDVFGVREMTDSQWAIAIEYALEQVGKGYDYWGCVRFVSRRRLPENDKWFCSELVFAALQRAGISLLHRIRADEVSPGMLSLSPLMIPAQ